MSETDQFNPLNAKQARRKRNMIAFGLLLLLIAVIFLVLHYTVWRYEIETDDAYVNANMVQISAQIPGTIERVNVHDTSYVKAGDVLAKISPIDVQLALEKAKADVRSAVKAYKVNQAAVLQAQGGLEVAKAGLLQAQAQFESAQAQFNLAQDEYQARQRLVGTAAVSKEDVKRARSAFSNASAQLDVAKQNISAAKARIDAAEAQLQSAKIAVGNSNDMMSQPQLKIALTELRNAWINVQRATIHAPVDGQVGRSNLHAGQYIAPGIPFMVIVPLHQVWVDANFKETDLSRIHPGQKVQLYSDIYGDDIVYHGVVEGLSAGTGSAFSVLPAQNATGNWIKIVQRVPVRISLNEKELAEHPLRIGLSMTVKINTKQKGNGQSLVSASNRLTKEAQDWNMKGLNQLIHELTTSNE